MKRTHTSIRQFGMLAGLLLLPLAAAAANFPAFTSSGQTQTINGMAETWTSTVFQSSYYVGTGSFNTDTLNIINGGSLTLGSGNYLTMATSSNKINVTGAGSLLSVPVGAISIASLNGSGANNTLTVSAGGRLSGGAWGTALNGTGNAIVVTDAGSTWDAKSISFQTGSGNGISVLAGGTLTGTEILLGWSGRSSTVTVSGAGSSATMNQVVLVGSGNLASSNDNLLLIASGGAMTVKGLSDGGNGYGIVIGPTAGQTGNRVQVDGGMLIVGSTATSTPAINVKRGSLVLNSGDVITEQLLANTGTASVVQFNGGTLTTNDTTVANGAVFTVGNGTSAATLNLQGGSHSFANGLALANNATLTGTGTISNGALTVAGGGAVAPGESGVGTLTVNGDVILNGTYSAEIGDLVAVVGNLSLGDSSVLSLSGGVTPGDTYTLASYTGVLTGTFATIDNLPPDWQVTYGATAITLSAAIPEPASLALFGVAALALLRRRRPAELG